MVPLLIFFGIEARVASATAGFEKIYIGASSMF
jgi:hypothetical protein